MVSFSCTFLPSWFSAINHLGKHVSSSSVALMHLMCYILQEELCRWRMTWSYHSSCSFAPWSSASSAAPQIFSNLFTVRFRIAVCFCHRILAVTGTDKESVYFYRSESAISKVQSPPGRTARRSQSKAKSRPPESEVDLQLLKTLCQENDCNSEEVWAPRPVSYRYTIAELLAQLQLYKLRIFVSFTPIFCLQVKNVYQTSFSAFLDSLDLSGSTHLPQVGGVDGPNTCVTVCLSTYVSIADLILLIVATIEQVCDSCWPPPSTFPACLFSHYMMSGKCVLRKRIVLSVLTAHYRVRHETEAGHYCLLIQKYCSDIFVLWRHRRSNRWLRTLFARWHCVNIV